MLTEWAYRSLSDWAHLENGMDRAWHRIDLAPGAPLTITITCSTGRCRYLTLERPEERSELPVPIVVLKRCNLVCIQHDHTFALWVGQCERCQAVYWAEGEVT